MKLKYTYDESVSITNFQQKINMYIGLLSNQDNDINKLVVLRCNAPRCIVVLPTDYLEHKKAITEDMQLTLTEFHKNVAKYTKEIEDKGEYVILKENKPYFVIKSLKVYEEGLKVSLISNK